MTKTSQLLIAAAATCWGMTGVFTRQLTAAGFSYFEISAARAVFAAVCLIIFLLLTNRNDLKFNIKDLWIFLLMGCFGSALMSTLYFYTIEMITLSAASILLYTAPYMVMGMSALLFKEKITPQKLAALFIAFTGCIMTVGFIDSSELSKIGVASGLLCAFLYASNTIIAKFALRKYSPFVISAYAFAIASVLLIPLCDYGKVIALVCESGDNLRNILLLGFFIAVLPAILYYKGLEKTEPSRASIISFVEPLAAATAGFVVFDEVLSPIKILGMVLILVSLIILNLRAR